MSKQTTFEWLRDLVRNASRTAHQGVGLAVELHRDELTEDEGCAIARLLLPPVLDGTDAALRSEYLETLADLATWDQVPDDVREQLRTVDVQTLSKLDRESIRYILDPDADETD